MQDVGRTYISTDELKREIAILARYKINVFHWHLTENSGMAPASKVFPMLNDSVQHRTAEAGEILHTWKRHGNWPLSASNIMSC